MSRLFHMPTPGLSSPASMPLNRVFQPDVMFTRRQRASTEGMTATTDLGDELLMPLIRVRCKIGVPYCILQRSNTPFYGICTSSGEVCIALACDDTSPIAKLQN